MAVADWTFAGTWPYESRWLTTSDGVRIHYVDEGPRDGQPVVLLHGNPTWSYLYRNFIRALVDAGFRAVAHDEMGFGRSDKPEREAEYTKPPLLFRLIRARGTGELLVKRLHVFVRVFLFKGGTRKLDENAQHAYLAPHPTPASRTGVLAYPRLIPWDSDSPTLPLGRKNEEGLSRLADKPLLLAWPTKDRGFKEGALRQWRERFPSAEVRQFEGGHYIQEDAPEQVIPVVVDFLRRT